MNKLNITLARTACVAIMIGFASVASAAESKGPSGPGAAGAPVALNFDSKTCNAEDRAAITEAFSQAKDQVAAGLALVQRNPNDPRVTRWFGDAPRGRVADVLQSVLRKLEQPGSFTIACRTSYCEMRRPMAYADPEDGLVGFCAAFFRASLTGTDSRIGTVVHEVSHLTGTHDHAYGRGNVAALGARDSGKAANNADSYEYFIETLAE